MKKIGLIIAVVLLLSMNAESQSIKKGDVVFDVFYGYIPLPQHYSIDGYSRGAFIYAEKNGNFTDVIGPLGIRFEYLLSDKFGIDVKLSHTFISTKYTKLLPNGDVSYKKSIYAASRIFTSFNYHFATTKYLDPYCFVGIGNSKYDIETKEEISNMVDDNIYIYREHNHTNIIGVRTGVGLRYFIYNKVGVNIEAGAGNACFFQFGLTSKL